MRRLKSEDVFTGDIADKFGVSYETARTAIVGTTWKYLKTPYDDLIKINSRCRIKVSDIEITQELVKKLFKYDPKEGILRWNYRKQGSRLGRIAGYFSKGSGHYYTSIGHVGYYTHIIIWLYMTGEWPTILIDHKDGNKINNKWENLRLATKSQNGMNAKLRVDNTSGCKGVYRHKPSGKWHVRIHANNVAYSLGYFATYEEAVAARREAEIKYHGEFARAE